MGRRHGRAALCLLAILLIPLMGCSGPASFRLTPEQALLGFREASPVVDRLADDAAAVAVFVAVEGRSEGCPHDGVLLMTGGGREEVVLRCLEEPRAPGGYSYHQLVVLRHPDQVESLRRGALELGDFERLSPHGNPAQEENENAPGWIISTHRAQLLFGDQTVRQRLETPR